jgi:hypothetical protein
MPFYVMFRQLNASVRFLLNAIAQINESVILNFTEEWASLNADES